MCLGNSKSLLSMALLLIMSIVSLIIHIKLGFRWPNHVFSNVADTEHIQNVSRHTGYVTSGCYRGRLGNQLFTLAAVVYFSELTGRQPVLDADILPKLLLEVFDLNIEIRRNNCPCLEFVEQRISYDKRIESVIMDSPKLINKTIRLCGYFQSSEYVEKIDRRLRKLFTFKSKYKVVAENFLKANIPYGWTKKRFTRVGIHIRRTDFTLTIYTNAGFTFAPESYFHRGMKYFTDMYESVQFVVASDEIKWAMEHIVNNSSSPNVNITYSVNHSPGDDMAILSMCDHVILSVGSFGWWSAWLAKGSAIYYANYPIKNSSFYRQLNPADYYPSAWIPML